MRKLTEAQIQRAVFDWATVQTGVRDYMLHPPNGGYRHVAEAANLKRQGVTPGVSDIFLALPSNGFCGLWIELKAPGGKPTLAQQDWLDKMLNVGYQAKLCYGFEEAVNTILNYIQGGEHEDKIRGYKRKTIT